MSLDGLAWLSASVGLVGKARRGHNHARETDQRRMPIYRPRGFKLVPPGLARRRV